MDGWCKADWTNGRTTDASHWFIKLATGRVIIWLAEYINSKFLKEKIMILTYSNSFPTIPSISPLLCKTAVQIHWISRLYFDNILNMGVT
jgi:hypothetical protein